MSDALTDIAREGDINKTKEELLKEEQEFLKHPNVEDARVLIRKWLNFGSMQRGYWSVPPKSLIRNHAHALVQYTEGEISTDELNSHLTPSNEQHFYLAVGGGHGGVMGNLEEIIIEAMHKKFGEQVHSFNLSIDDEGRITIDRITCGKCPRTNYCEMQEACNCYDLKESKENTLLAKKRKMTLEKYAKTESLEREVKRLYRH